MNEKASIGAGQLFSLLFVCRLLTTVTFSPTFGDGVLSGNFLPEILVSGLMTLLLIIPPALFYRKYRTQTPVSVLKNRSGLVNKTLCIFYSFVFLYSASLSLSRFYIFLTSVIFPEKKLGLFLVAAVLLCAYCAFLGLEALARGNTILLFLTVSGVALILFLVIKDFSIYNLEPFFFSPPSQIIRNSFFSLGRTVEAAAFLFLAPKANGKMKKSFIICFALYILSLAILFLFLGGVSGEFAKTQLFPFYSLASIARFPFFERLDAIITAVFIFSILIKCSLFILISRDLLTDSFRIKPYTGLVFCFLFISAFSLFISQTPSVHKTASNPIFTGILTLLGVAVIPAALLIGLKKRGVAK